jgi:molybdate transport system substrate-binding protein
VAKLKVMCARSMHVAVGALGKAFAEGAGHEVAFDFGTVGYPQSKLDAGETADVVILSVPGIDKLAMPASWCQARERMSPRPTSHSASARARRGRISRRPRRSSVCWRAPAPSPPAIPAVGGSAGVHLAKAFEQAGLAAMMAPKSMPQQTGAEVAKRVVEGNAEFGLTLSGEVASVPGAVIAGPACAVWPGHHYCAAVMAGSAAKEAAAALIAALTQPDTRATWTRAGFDQHHLRTHHYLHTQQILHQNSRANNISIR